MSAAAWSTSWYPSVQTREHARAISHPCDSVLTGYPVVVTRKHTTLAVALAILGGLSSACDNTHESAVNGAVDTFYRAVDFGDGATACGVLAPKTRDELEQLEQVPCEEAVLEADIPRVGQHRSTTVYGTMAMVRYSNETTFLAEFADGWRVLAAGCKPIVGKPYDCTVKGG
jgi:hypothetical protein